ncbi:lysylphosphatidylglycerol synthase domain-containing protein [Corallibacter sp.]|uniref:lysylphosphatidylglycerol synthase domain-containing protein n=1 Tax=Corallibacter sp. TaxID=2038084 RepID=UPI003AB88810
MFGALPYKTKQFFFVLIKLSIVVGAFYFIYQKLTSNEQLDFIVFWRFLKENNVFSLKNIYFLISLSFFNWFFEILKWKHLVSFFKKISFKTATKQTLGSLTASIFTPNRIGEYGAKALFYKPEHRKKIVALNVLGNSMQMLITVILGCIGLYFFVLKYPMDINYYKVVRFAGILLIIAFATAFGLSKKNVSIKGVSVKRIIDFFKKISTRFYATNFSLSVIRYLIFSYQFFILLQIFGIDVSYFNAMIVITSMYLLSSIIPSIFIFDVVIKGSVALYLFSIVGINAFTILSIITLMWILNFVIPSVIGSYYVMVFNQSKDQL